MRKFSKIALGSFVFLILFSIFSMTSVLAAGETEIPVETEEYQWRIKANNQTMFNFMEQTRLRFKSNVDIDLTIDCDASEIGVKYFEMEINGSGPLSMNMVCREEQNQLGLQKGSTFRIRNRYRYTYQEGFCAYIQCNDSCQAKLKIQANNQNRNGQWAYYHEGSQEWLTVPTTIEDGYLVTETTSFSYWTVLIPEIDNTLLIYVSIGVIVGVIAIFSVMYLKKRK